MPVYSMTGYASGQNGPAGSHADTEPRPHGAGRLGVEIRSVNSRFLDLTFKLPEELRQHEPALRELLTGQLKRGKVELRASIEGGGTAGIGEPSPKLLQRLNGVQDNIKSWLPAARELSVADVLRLAAGDTQAKGDLGPELSEVAEKTLKALVSAREREGARLARMLQDHLPSCASWSSRRCRWCPSSSSSSAPAFSSAGRRPWASPPAARHRKRRRIAP